MISVVIPTLNAAETLYATLDQFRNSLIKQVIVVDGGSSDATTEIARAMGARVVDSERGRGQQLRAGAQAAETDWMLFMHADTRLGPGWQNEVGRFVAERDNALRGAVFSFQVDDKSEEAHRLERMVAWRNRVLDLPYGDQGLLIHRILYNVVGGFEPLPLMEDVDFMRRLRGPVHPVRYAGDHLGPEISRERLYAPFGAQPSLPRALLSRRFAENTRAPLSLRMQPAHLILFGKAPRIGSVKTRLARDIGRYEAWRFYRDTTNLMLKRLSRDRRWRTVLAVTPDHFARRAGFWSDALPRMPQGPGDIGTRMARAFDAMPDGPIVLVGADIPALGRKQIVRAFRLLRRSHLVFGPSTDGGYWLVGSRSRKAIRNLFRNVRWSGPHALADTIANAGRRKVALLDPLTDIDTGADYRAWKEKAQTFRCS